MDEKLFWIGVGFILFMILLASSNNGFHVFGQNVNYAGYIKIPCLSVQNCESQLLNSGYSKAQIQEMGIFCKDNVCYMRGERSVGEVKK